VVEEDGRIQAQDRRAGRVAAAEATLELGQRLKDRAHVSPAQPAHVLQVRLGRNRQD
jgi:hypothetical protein